MSDITAIIVDDLKNCIDVLCKDLKRYPDIKIIEATTSIERAKASVLKHQPALLFLDIEMPKQSGLEFLQEISPYIHPHMCIVFYSVFDKYMKDALRASAFDFLLKPYQLEELDYIINRVKKKILSGQTNFEFSRLYMLNPEKKFGIYTSSGTALLLSKPEILYFEYLPEVRCWHIKLTNFTVHKLQTSTTSKDILEMDASFAQIKRECIINLNYISSIDSKYECSLYPPFQNIKFITTRRYYLQLKKKLDFL